MGPRSLACRIAIVAAAIFAIIATYDDGVAARSVIETISRQGSSVVKDILPVSDTAGTDTVDAVSAALGVFVARKPNVLISGVDWEDRTSVVDIATVDNNQVVTYRVNADGKIAEYSRENDPEQIAKARAATVPIVEAIAQARSQKPHGIIDTVTIEDEDGLHWKLSLDDGNFSDLATIRIAAR